MIMKKNNIFLFIFLFVFFLMTGIGVQVQASGNTTGYAWSENIGWISFNSINCDSNEDGTTDTGNYPQCPIGSSITDYGVNIDPTTGDLSGYAWSENIGWISFNREDTGNPPTAPFNGDSGPIAQYNFSTHQLTGWGRALAYGDGWDGWIRFCDTDICLADQIAQINTDGSWHGWAWGSDVVGWISFNSSDSGASGGADYRVKTKPFTLSVSLSADPSSGQFPLTTTLTADVSGTISGSTTYYFWEDCNYDCSTVSDCEEECGPSHNNDSSNVYSATYNEKGTYYPKVIVERGGTTAEARTTVTVTNPPPKVDIKADNSDGPITKTSGSSVNLSWTSSYADSCEASGSWSGGKPANGSETIFNLLGPQTYTYTLTCLNDAGSTSDSVVVNITAPRPEADIWASTSDGNAVGQEILGGTLSVDFGDRVTISWNSKNAKECTISPSGWTGINGSEDIDAFSSITYTLRCTGSGGTSEDTIEIKVNYFLPKWKEIIPW